MNERFVETEQARAMLLRFIEAHSLPFAVTIQRGRKRTIDQNRLQRLWMNEIAEQLGDRTPEEVRAYCKLHFGVPIRRNASDKYREQYDEAIRPLPYEMKLKLMSVPLDFAVTRDMTTKQLTAYLDAVHKHFTEQGVTLTEPARESEAA